MGILKNQLTQSKHSLKGATPATREGALPGSQLHAQGKPTVMKAEHSVHDLDGLTPSKYTDNLPE